MIPRRIVFIGASSVFGRGDPEGGGFAGRFRKWFESQNNMNTVFNLGISGDTTYRILERLEQESKIRYPNLIIIQTGLNDTMRTGSEKNPISSSLEQFKTNVKRIIEKSCEIADVIMLSVCPIDERETAPIKGKNIFYLMGDIKIYTDATRQVCEEKNTPYLNIFDDWIKTDFSKYLYADGLHYNAEGHKEIFKRLKDFIIRLYPDGPDI